MSSNNSIIVQIRRGTTAQTSSFTGALAELTVDTDQKTLVIHDGVTSGGNYLSTKAFTQQVYDFANTISGGSASDNVARVLAQSAYNTANGANGLAAGAFNKANTNADAIAIIQGVDLSQNTRLNSIETINLDQNTAIAIIQGTDATQNVRLNSIETVNIDQNTAISIIQGTDATQNVRLGSIETTNDNQNTAIGIIQGVDSWQNTEITSVNQFAAGAYNQANTGTGIAQAAFAFANTLSGGSATDNVARTLAQAAYDSSNLVNQFTQSAYNTANGANGLAAGAYNQANTNAGNIVVINGVNDTQNVRLGSIETVNIDQNTAISIIQGVNLGQNTTITAVNNFAQSAYNTANNKFNSSGGTISGDVAVTGNLTVTGETFYANVTNLNVDDSFIVLNANTVSTPVYSAGIEIDRGTANNTLLYWDEDNLTWAFTDDLQNYYILGTQIFSQEAFDKANNAYNLANGANGLASGAFNFANTSLQNSGDQILNGNLLINGSITTTQWANTANAYVSNKLYAGIAPQLSTPLPDLIAQFTGNTNSYVQVNAENIDPEGSADFVITADVGDDSKFYLDLGLHNSNREFGVTYPLDGYLLVQGNTGQIGGNLIIGTTSQTPGQHTKIIAGGGEESNVVIQFNDDLSTIFYGNAIPSVTNSQYLGSSTKRWHSLYVGPGSVDIDNIVLSNNNGKLVISGASDIVISGSSVPSTGDISNKANNAYDRANAAFASSNAVNSYAQSAYATANGANGLAAGAFNTANGANGLAAGAFNTANGANGLAAGAFNTANGANGLAAGAFNQANTGTSIAEAAFAFANTLSGGSATDNVARTLAQSAYNSSNLVNQFAAGAFNTANGANGLAAGAYAQANTNADAIAIIQGVNLGQNTTITAVNNYAASAYATANSKFNSSGGTISGDVNVTGNLSVTGTTFYANTEQLHVKDNIITLNSNVTGVPTLDAGIEVNRGSETNTVLKWSETDHAWEFTNDGTNFFRIADTGRVNSAFALANTNAGAIAIIQGVNLGQNTTITAVNDFAAGAFNTANGANGLAAGAYAQANTNAGAISIIQGVDLTQNTNIIAVNNFTQSAFNTANGANGLAAGAYAQANTNAGAIAIIQGVNLGQNTTITAVNNFASSAFNTANGANGLAAGAFAAANTNASNISIIQGVDLTQNTNITAVNNYAASAYNQANTNSSNITAVNGFAQSAFNTANGANGLANGAYAAANTAYSYTTQVQAIAAAAYLKANSAFDSSNAVNGYAVSAFATANGANGLAQGAFNTANTNAGNITIIQGVDATQNIRLNAIETINTDQNTAISIIQGVDLTQNTRLNSIETINTDQNTAISIIQGVDLNQNTQISGIQGVDLAQNSAISIIQGVDLAQNTRMSIIEGVNDGQNTTITAVNNFASSSYDKANSANILAQAAFDTANLKFNTSGGNINGSVTITANNNLTVTGNLFVLGNTTSFGTQTLEVVDPMILLAAGNYTSDLLDIGFSGTYNDGANAHTGLFRDAPGNKDWYFFEGYTPEVSGNNNINTADASFRTSNVNVNYLKGNLIATTAVVDGVNIRNVQNTQNTNITAVNNYAASAYAQANTNATNISITNGVDATQNTRLNSIETINTNQNTTISIIQGVDLTQNTRIQSIETINTNQNTAISIIQGVDLNQNTRIQSIETINTNQNTAISIIQGVDLAQNAAITIIQGVDLTQNTNITAVNNFAAGAFAQANTANTRAFSTVLKSGDTMSGSLTGVTTLGTTTISFAQTDATTNTFTTASTAQVSVDAWPTASYRSAKYFVQVTSGSSYHIIELNLVHNGTTVFLAQYGEVITNASLGTFDADISGATVRLLFTGTNAVSTVRVLRTVMDV